MSLFEGWFGSSDRAGDSEWSTDTSVCAGCGRPVALGEPHYTVVRNVERITADGEAVPEIGDDLAHTHLDCWPGGRAEIAAGLNEPDSAKVRGGDPASGEGSGRGCVVISRVSGVLVAVAWALLGAGLAADNTGLIVAAWVVLCAWVAIDAARGVANALDWLQRRAER